MRVGSVPIIATRVPCAAAAPAMRSTSWVTREASAVKGRPASSTGGVAHSMQKRPTSRAMSSSPPRRLLHGDVLAGRPAGGVHERHLELGADRGRALAEAGALQQLRQGDQALAEALREALEVGPAEPLALDLTAHRANATPNRAIRPRPGSSGVRHGVRPA